MEEIEVPVERVQEEIHHRAAHGGDRMSLGVALSSAILAALAAVAALLSGHRSNEAMLEQLHASDAWSYYQAKGIKSAILEHQASPSEKDREKIAEYKREQDEIKRTAEEHQKESERQLRSHETFASSVTFFQVAIAIGAIAALTHRRRFWWVSLVFGGIGAVYLAVAILHG